MSQKAQAKTRESTPASVHTGHPSPATYVKVAITLAALTAAEVAIFYATFLGHGIIPILVILSGAKFALVIMFYMHLRYDARIFSGMFLAGLVVAGGIILALMTLFKFFI